MALMFLAFAITVTTIYVGTRRGAAKLQALRDHAAENLTPQADAV
jgi:hypothetical protein